MTHNSEHRPCRAMAPEAAPAPGAHAACKIDLADNSPPDQFFRVRRHHFSHELVAGCSGKAVVAALQFQIGIADASRDETNESETLGPPGLGGLPDFNFPGVQVNGDHCDTLSIASFRQPGPSRGAS